MDSLTQIVLGAAMGEAVAGRKIGAKAALWGAIGGTIPDLDVFLRFFYDPLDAALVHRGFSHSLVFALLAGPMLGWLSHKLSKEKFTLNMWTLLWFFSIVTHPLLDIFTNYGTQFFWPFSPRISFNSVFVIDPLYTIPFMVFLIGALCIKRESKRRKVWNWTGIIYSSLYLLWGVIIKLWILNDAPKYFEGRNVKQIMVTPMPLTSFYWQITAETDSAYITKYKSIFSDHLSGSGDYRPKNHHLLKQIDWNGENRIHQIKYITKDFYAIEQHHDSLFIFDIRFGMTKKLSGNNVNEPIMGYGILLNNRKPVNYFGYRTTAFGQIEFWTYVDYVFGSEAQIIND
jgi:inner membrane protein